MIKRILKVFIVGLIVAVGAESALANVGKVIIAKGETYALDTSNNSRLLKRRSDIFEGDTLVTGVNSEIHIRFQDNAVLALRADSQLKISDYHAASGGQNEKVLMELLSGGFRTITGAFGKTDKEAYQIRTPNASIGIRGTNYEALLSGKDLLVGVYQGGIRLENKQGSFDLGRDSAFSFAQVSGRGNVIEGLMEAPSELAKPLATSFTAPPVPNEDVQKETTAQIKDEDEGLLVENLFEAESDSLRPLAQPAPRPAENLLATVSTADSSLEDIREVNESFDLTNYQDLRLTQTQIQTLEEGAPVGFVVVNEDATGYRLPIYAVANDYDVGSNNFITAGALTFDMTLRTDDGDVVYSIDLTSFSGTVFLELQSQLANQAGDVNGTAIPPQIQIAAVNGKLVFTGLTGSNNAEIIFDNFQGTDAVALAQELGLCVASASCTGSYNLGAPSVGDYNHSAHFGYIVDGENGPVFVNFENESIYALDDGYKSPDNVFRGNAETTNTQFAAVDLTGNGVNDVSWGHWAADANNPALLLKDPKNLNIAESVESAFFYVEAPPAQEADMVGQMTMNTVVDWHASSSTTTGLIDSSGTATLMASLDVNFSTSDAVGNLQLMDSGQNWNWSMDYYGEVSGAQFFSDYGYGSLVNDAGTVNAVGHVDGLFTPVDTGVGFIGGFGMQTADDAHQAEGIFIIK